MMGEPRSQPIAVSSNQREFSGMRAVRREQGLLQKRPQCSSPFPSYQRLGFLPQAREPGAAGVAWWSTWDWWD